MKKLMASILIASLTFSPLLTGAQDSQLINAVEGDLSELSLLDLEFEQFSSCEEMTMVLEEFAEKSIRNRPYPYYRGGGGIFLEEEMIDFADSDDALDSLPSPVAAESAAKTVRSSTDEFSQTNLQKEEVDEPDILKTDGDYLYYYNAQQQTISIIKGPLNLTTQTLNLDRVEVLNEIEIPSSMNSVDLYLHEEKLVIVGHRYSEGILRGHLNRNDRTVIAVYDKTNKENLDLIHFQEVDGRKENSRLHIDDETLHVMSQIHFNRRYGYPERLDTQEVAIDIDTDIFLPTNTVVRKVNDTFVSSSIQTDCSDIHYLMPSGEGAEQMNIRPSFTVVTSLDLDDFDHETNVVFGQPSQIHVSDKGIYFAQSIWMPNQFQCPSNARCSDTFFRGGENHTLVHGFHYDFDYKGSALIQGSPLGDQYSMDEHDGEFRILTQTWNQGSATHLTVLDRDLDILGSLHDIEPGERFQGARFIEDKLYMITFRQIDPLFVIDLENSTDPEIIGELKMPGFSNYLHPLGEEENGIQYLAGIGYDTDINQRGGTRTAGVKLDIYKVDYNKNETIESLCGRLDNDSEEYDSCLDDFDGSRIRVEQIASTTLGGQGSYTPVTDNPRLFVINNDMEITLPLLLKENNVTKQSCNTIRDGQGNIIEEECWDIENQEATFVGLKSFALNTQQGTITETFSRDYLDLIKNSKDVYYNLGSRYLQQIGMRVGFVGDSRYLITNLFADFILNDDSTTLLFDESLE